MNKVALIGCGAMGGAIGTRLAEIGEDLAVFDLNPDAVARLVEKGAKQSASAAAAAQGKDFVITSLNSAEIVRAAMFGSGGVVEGAAPGTMIIDMSSIDPPSTVALAKQAREAGLSWVDAPLSGGAPKALVGALTVMAGGTAEDFERSKSVMSGLCANYTHMGPSGAGQTTKLINQLLCGIGFLAVAEATRLAQDAGVDAAQIPIALAGGRADSAILQEYMPRMAAKDYTPTGRIANMVKDLNGVQDLARITDTAMPLTATCAEVHRLLTATGLGNADQAALMELFEDRDTRAVPT
ncbi:MAG: NAD(P)-dependent oxidoreductase [Pseudomonadota bacterium]